MRTKKRKTGARLGAILLSLCLLVGLLPVTAFASDAPIKRNTYNVYSDEVIAGGADSQVYAVTIENVDGENLHYVYSPNAIYSNELMEQIRAGLEEPYKSLIPTFEGADSGTGFLCFSREQAKYETMNLGWDNPEAVANALISGSGSVSVAANDSAISVTDISVTHADEKVVSEKQVAAEDFYTNPPELGQLASGKNRVETWTGLTTYKSEKVEDKAYYDVFDYMHVIQISAYTATKEEEGTAPTKRDTYNVYSDAAIAGGADSQVYAVTIENVDGEDLHYVYSRDVIHSKDLMEQIRAGLKEPYKSLIPIFEEDDIFHVGFLLFSRDQEKYEKMSVDWKNPESATNSLISGKGSVSVTSNDSAVSVTDISVTHADEKVVSEKQLAAEDFYTNPPELGQLGTGENRVEAMVGVTYRTETVEDKAYYDVFNTMHVAQISAFTARKHPVTWDTYFKSYTDASLNGGSDSQVYAATIRDENGDFTLHYVYSPNAIHSNDLMDQIRAGLADPYKSLIPKFAQDDLSKQGFLCFSNDPEKYESMDLDWADAEAVAAALIPGEGTVTCAMRDDAVSVTDISEIDHEGAIIIEEGFCDPDLDVPLSIENGELIGSDGDLFEEIDLHPGKNRVEAKIENIKINIWEVAGNLLVCIYPNPYHVMHVSQISTVTATKAASVSNSISLPVRVLEEGDADYSPAPELSATFTPDTAVTVGEFNEWQGLAIDYYYPMVDAELSEGYDIQAGYTVSIPLTDYEGETLSGTLTIPLPKGYDGATARIKGGASASSYTATTVTFPLTLDVSGNTAEADLLIEYKEAQEPVQPPVIIAGANGSWQKSGTDGLSFTSDAEYADFLKVMVDGKELKTTDYTVKEGSTIVTLNAAYLETLSVGKHTLEIESKNGIAKTEFTITAVQGGDDSQTGGDQTGGNQTGGDDSQTGGDQTGGNQTGGSDQTVSDTTPQEPDKNGGDKTNPQTGDSSNILLWVALLFLSGGALSAVTYKKKKQTN